MNIRINTTNKMNKIKQNEYIALRDTIWRCRKASMVGKSQKLGAFVRAGFGFINT